MIALERVQLATAESDDGVLDVPDQLNQLAAWYAARLSGAVCRFEGLAMQARF